MSFTCGGNDNRVKCEGRDTHETKPVCIWVISDVLRQVPTRRPFKNELERIRGSAEERDDVLVIQAFPHYDLLVERLRAASATGDKKTVSTKQPLLPPQDHPWSTS